MYGLMDDPLGSARTLVRKGQDLMDGVKKAQEKHHNFSRKVDKAGNVVVGLSAAYIGWLIYSKMRG